MRIKIHFSGEEWFLVISLCVVGALYLFITLNSAALHDIERGLTSFADFLLRQGYLGAFIIAFLSNSSVFIVIPYLPAIFFLGSVGLSPLLLGIIAGLGSALGEVVSYAIGWLGGRLLAKKHVKRFAAINNLLRRKRKLAPILIFLFAFLPIPDDILVVPLAVVRYPLLKALPPLILGKVAHTTLAAYLGSASFHLFEQPYESAGTATFLAITLVLTILIIYFTLKVEWERFVIDKVKQIEKNL